LYGKVLNDKFNFKTYNIANREAENELLPLAHDKGLAIITNRPFDEGGLFNAVYGKKLPEWAKDYGINSWANYFLKFVIANPSVTCSIPATTNPLHMIENLQSVAGELTDAGIRKKMVQYFENI
jgi:diketogulonate reductase-like aldo/keto reductase